MASTLPSLFSDQNIDESNSSQYVTLRTDILHRPSQVGHTGGPRCTRVLFAPTLTSDRSPQADRKSISPGSDGLLRWPPESLHMRLQNLAPIDFFYEKKWPLHLPHVYKNFYLLAFWMHFPIVFFSVETSHIVVFFDLNIHFRIPRSISFSCSCCCDMFCIVFLSIFFAHAILHIHSNTLDFILVTSISLKYTSFVRCQSGIRLSNTQCSAFCKKRRIVSFGGEEPNLFSLLLMIYK